MASFPTLLDMGDRVTVRTDKGLIRGKIGGLSVVRQPDLSFSIKYDVTIENENTVIQVSSNDIVQEK